MIRAAEQHASLYSSFVQNLDTENSRSWFENIWHSRWQGAS